MPEPNYILYWLRNYAAQGILQKAKAIIFRKPYQEKYYEEYKEVIRKIINEFDLKQIPVVLNMTFGHNEPMFILLYGATAEVNCIDKTFSIIESGVL